MKQTDTRIWRQKLLRTKFRFDKVITAMVVGPLDDRTCCAFTHFGLRRKFYDCSLHHFTTIQSILKCADLGLFLGYRCLAMSAEMTSCRNPRLFLHTASGLVTTFQSSMGSQTMLVQIVSSTARIMWLVEAGRKGYTHTKRRRSQALSSCPTTPCDGHDMSFDRGGCT